MRDTSAPSECLVRRAEERDLPAINAIYNDVILNSVATFDTQPMTLEDHRVWLHEHSDPYVVLVAERDGEVAGWASLGPFRWKAAYRYTAENSVYVRSDAQGNGIGVLLMDRLMEAAKENGFHAVIARITAGNPASERLHRRFGFEQVGTERQVGRKFDRWLDVVVMQKLLQ